MAESQKDFGLLAERILETSEQHQNEIEDYIINFFGSRELAEKQVKDWVLETVDIYDPPLLLQQPYMSYSMTTIYRLRPKTETEKAMELLERKRNGR